MHALERDNFYFKQAARELRRQLKEVTSGSLASGGAPALAGSAPADGDGSAGHRRAQTADAERTRLERENTQLANELANLKKYLLKNPSAQMVRVSKRDHALLAGQGGPPRDSTGSAHNVER